MIIFLIKSTARVKKLLMLETYLFRFLEFHTATGQCTLSPCEVFEIMTRGSASPDSTGSGCATDLHWRQLDRRLRAIEQPSEYGFVQESSYNA